MKRFLLLLFIMSMALFCGGCHRHMGVDILERLGMKFTSQIEMIEECLSIDLDDLTDDCIEIIYSHTDPHGNELSIKYIDLDGAGEYILNNITSLENWHKLPYDDEVKLLLERSGANEYFAFEAIKEGYFTISGALIEKNGFDFDRRNFDDWDTFEIGIWESSAETLYFISIAMQ